ncbi:exported hypothetical protein [metagenome]|uniref:Lipoprotein LpqN n=1 Tax=metagenome TaxID=256318 RepID=A0A2P2CGB2_9ZZZZ
MRNLAFVAASVLLVAGCGSSGDGDSGEDPAAAADETSAAASPSTEPSAEPAESPSVEPANGMKLDAVAFSLTVPKGWDNINEGDDKSVVLYAADLRSNGETPDMVTVRRVSGTAPSVGQAGVRGADRLKTDGATRIKVLDPVEVCGSEVAHVRAIQTTPGVHTMLNQYSVAAADDTWLITFATNQWQVEQDRSRLLDSVLATCTLAG